MIILKKKMEPAVLLRSPLFRGLSETEIESVLSGILFRTKKYKPGNMIAVSGEEVNSLQIVTGGTVKGEMTDIAGRVIKIEDIPAGGALAPAFMFGNRNRFPVNVIAVTGCEILIIDKPQFLRMLRADDRLLVNFLDMISNRSQFLSDKIKFLNFKTIKGKLAQMILQKAGEGKEINIGMTQSELADFFGVARPSVARALGEMEQEGLIIASAKTVRITDRKGLAALTSD